MPWSTAAPAVSEYNALVHCSTRSKRRLSGLDRRGGRGLHDRAGCRDIARLATRCARYRRRPRLARGHRPFTGPAPRPRAAVIAAARDRNFAAALRHGLAEEGLVAG